MSTAPQTATPPWTRLLSLSLCLLTFPLIWVGGLITTTDAGMAVPDWPGTYGYNLFAYPLEWWWSGPWDLFVEHGHRLLASLVGLVTIVLVVAVWRSGTTRLARLSWLALGLVIFQGVLGGLRVVLNERLLAMAHGVTGPLFFALTCVIVGRLATGTRGDRVAAARVGKLALLLAAAVFAQLALGAALRHMPETASPWAFATVLKFHLLGAAVVTLLSLGLAVRAGFRPGLPRATRLASGGIGLAVLVQVAAGVGAWLLKYGLPGWAEAWAPVNIGANTANGMWQTCVVTAHQAGGSLLLGLSAFVATRTLTGTGATNLCEPLSPNNKHEPTNADLEATQASATT